jgi:hypothetical protein
LCGNSLRSATCIFTRDFDFSDVRNYPPADCAGVIVLELPDDAIAATVVRVLESLLSQPELVVPPMPDRVDARSMF